ncbi:MAG: hypothetical protein COB14_07060 [Alphaproteobacteria bacterium]|nr:MAG: hypothetical protein COB14_07060 [Alphaproteobacteria bacterium]
MSNISKNIATFLLASTVGTSAIAENSNDLSWWEKGNIKSDRLESINAEISAHTFTEDGEDDYSIGKHKIFIDADNGINYTQFHQHIDLKHKILFTDTDNVVPLNTLDSSVRDTFTRITDKACNLLSERDSIPVKEHINQYIGDFGSDNQIQRLTKRLDDTEHFKEEFCP